MRRRTRPTDTVRPRETLEPVVGRRQLGPPVQAVPLVCRLLRLLAAETQPRRTLYDSSAATCCVYARADFGMQSARDMAGSETDVNPLEAMYLNRCACASVIPGWYACVRAGQCLRS